jgi:hypothetical protein
MNQLIQSKNFRTVIVLATALVGFRLMPMAQAVGPDTDGAIAGFNNGEGIGVLINRAGGIWNTGTGFQALNHLTAGNQNTATGVRALFSDTNGGFNTATGVYSLFSNTSGFFNSATGAYSLARNTTGSNNTANGCRALFFNTEGEANTAIGLQALYRNTTDSFNTAIGFQALFSNTGFGGHNNVATGYQALYSNRTGRRNVADGNAALYSNVVGNFNVAVGDQALFSLAPATPDAGNSGGNTAVGEIALVNLTTGGGNTAIGESALLNSVTGFQNVALGYIAGQNLTTGNNNVYISNPSIDTESNTIRIGNVVGFTDMFGFPHAAHTATYIAGISGQTASGGVSVFINSDGKLGTLTSSARFKTDIKPMDKASEAIHALKPVIFHYKKELDPESILQFGLVAEEVEKINPELVVRDKEGKPYSVRYEAVNAMLLNEFLKEHRRNEQQEASIAQLKSTVAKQQATIEQQRKDFEATTAQQQQSFQSKLAEQDKQIEGLAAGLQKVSDQLELNKPAPRTVSNP